MPSETLPNGVIRHYMASPSAPESVGDAALVDMVGRRLRVASDQLEEAQRELDRMSNGGPRTVLTAHMETARLGVRSAAETAETMGRIVAEEAKDDGHPR